MRGTALIATTIGAVLCAATPLSTPACADDLELPPGPDRALVYGQCRTCHDLQYLKESAGIPRDSWDEIINSMKQYGLRIPAEQRARILDYLDTYLGPNPPPAAESATQPAAAQTAKVDGKTVFEEQCAACHQPNGQGVADQFPPLARNADVFLAPDFPLHVVLFGIKGKITVNGQKFDSAMPPLDVLSDAQIAAVVGYVRQNFGNAALRPQDMGTVDAASVAAVRGKTQSPEEVLAYREKLKAIRASR